MKFKNILFFSFLFLSISNVFSQDQSDSADDVKRKRFKDRLQYNIGGGLMLGNTYSNINIQPQVGYRINNRLTTGIGGNFQYYKNTYYSSSPFIIYGGNVFTRYKLTQNLFAQAEYQRLNFRNNWGEYAMIGGGYIPSKGVYISAYYLLLYPSTYNIYGAPYVLRVGFIF